MYISHKRMKAEMSTFALCYEDRSQLEGVAYSLEAGLVDPKLFK